MDETPPIEWDEKKRQATLLERNVDFLDAALIFEGPLLEIRDDRNPYGENRIKAVGEVDGTCFVVIYTWRDGARRIITAWKAGRNARRRYQEEIARRTSGNEGSR